MKKGTPKWAMEIATPQDRQRAENAYQNDTWQITWPETSSLRVWAKQQGWPAPWFIFKGGFIKKMLESDENFELALKESGLQILIPRAYYKISDKNLKAMDKLYKKRKNMGALG